MFAGKYKLKIEELEIEKGFLENKNFQLENRIQELEIKNLDLATNQGTMPDMRYIEIYMFKLLRFISSEEFLEIKSQKQQGVLYEFEYIKQTFNIIKNFYNKKEEIIAYRDTFELEGLEIQLTNLTLNKEKTPEQEKRHRELIAMIPNMRSDALFVYSFSCLEVASSVLDCSQTEILQCLIGSKKSSGGYKFEYEIEWSKSQPKESSIIKISKAWE
jgi:hypothetical protein